MTNNFSVSKDGLVGDELNSLTPASITNRLSKFVILDHAFNVERFHPDQAKIVYNVAAELVMKVSSLIGNLFVSQGYNLTLFRPSVTAFDFATKPTLPNLQATFRAFQVLGIVNLFTGRKNSKMFDSKVNANTVKPLNWFGCIYLALNGSKELTGLGSRHGYILGFPFNVAVIDTFHPTDFWQIDRISVELELQWIPDGLFVMLALELGIVGPTLKEVLVGFLQVHQGLLQNLSVTLFEPNMLNFEYFGKIGCTIVVVQAATRFLVVLFSNMTVVVVHKAGATKLNRKFFLLFSVRVDAELKRFANQHNAWIIQENYKLVNSCQLQHV